MPAKSYLTLLERLLEKSILLENGCLEWTASRNPKGYGQLNVSSIGKTAHRLSWKAFYGDIPKGLQVLHRCDNPPCINPLHLFLGTNLDNSNDKVRKGRQPFLKGEMNGASKMTEESVILCRKLYSEGRTQTSLAIQFGVHQTSIWRAVHRKKWKHI